MIQVITIPVGILETNSYLFFDSETKETFCVDPGAEAEKILKIISDNKLQLKAVLLTHGHGDHIGGINRLLSEIQVPIYVHPEDENMLISPQHNLSQAIGMDVTAPPADILVKEGQEISFGENKIKVIHTPGHTRGGVSYFIAPKGEIPVLFSGDTLFCLNVGRIDLPGGSWEVLQDSIKNKLYLLPEETVVYPGHGPATSILKEKNNNPYVCL